MKYTIITLAAFSALAFTAPAFADDSAGQVQDKVQAGKDGSFYEKGSASSSGTDANGTYTSNEKKVKIDIDKNGNGKKTMTTTSVNDPKGLFNKTKTVTTDTETLKSGSTEIDHKKTVNGSTVEKSSNINSDQ